MAKKQNLRIIGSTVGQFSAGDIVPAYALAAANPDFLVEAKLAEWTNETASVNVDTESLVQAAPDATTDLIKAHAKLNADNRELQSNVETLHAKCLDLEAKNKALATELAAKVDEIATIKSQREKIQLEFEDLKTLMEAETAPKDEPKK